MSARECIRVGVLARVVAAGLENRDGRRVGLATLSLMPWIPKAGETFGRSVDLARWPTEVATMIGRGLTLQASRIRKDDPAPTWPNPPAAALRTQVALRRSANLKGRDVDQVQRLWTNLMTAGAGDWTGLAALLRRSQGGDSLNDVRCGPATPKDADAAERGDDPSSTGKDRPDVFALPRADAALLYGLERAREVIRAVQGRKALCRIGDASVPTRGRTFDIADFTFARKPWLGLDGPLVRLAANGASDAGLGTKDLPGFARRDKLLADERRVQEARYRDQLIDKAKAAGKQADGRRAYLAAVAIGDRVGALAAHAAERATSIPPAACADACGVSASDSLTQALTDDVKATHSLGSLPDIDSLGDLVDSPRDLDDAFEVADRTMLDRLYAIVAMPSLARLFDLVIDVEFDLDVLAEELDLDPISASDEGFPETGVVDHFADLAGHDVKPGGPAAPVFAHYLFLSTDLGQADRRAACEADDAEDPPRVWTLAKLRQPQPCRSGAEAGHFWPCTREEVDLRLGGRDVAGLRDACAVFQFDGVVDLGVAYCGADGLRNPRYDIVSLDTIQTVESDVQSDRRLKARADEAPGDRRPRQDLGVHTRRSGGLAVLDRWRQDQVVSQIATAEHQTRPGSGSDRCGIVLDAEDMTLGFRLDVGLRTEPFAEKTDRPGADGNAGRVWRCLMNRTMTFGAGEDAWIDPAIASLYNWGTPERRASLPLERRRRADSASLSLASRIRDNGSERQDRARKTVFAEEIIVAWHGDPLGVDCLDPQGTPGAETEEHGLSIPADNLPLDIRYGLESGVDAYRPPPLRYGWPYTLGLRPVYLGGVILPLEVAIPRYEHNFGSGSALPRVRDEIGRRYLRHERIEAPPLTVPSGLADAVQRRRGATMDALASVRAGGATGAPASDDADPAAVDTGSTCLLRPREPGALAPVRVFFPPVLPLEQAALHGVFDGRDYPVERVEIAAERDGKDRIVRAARTYIRPVDGLKPLDFSGDPPPRQRDGSPGDAAPAQRRGGFPHHNPRKDDEPRGPALFRLGPRRLREVPFYPDPAAAFYVVAARRPNSDDYLDGTVTFPVREPGMAYPDVLPLAIAVRPRPARRTPARAVADLFPASLATLAPIGDRGTPAAGGLRARCVVAELAPGEDFEIEVWCAPAVADLRERFDIVESVSVLLARDSAADNFAEGRLDRACLDGLRRHFPDLGDAVPASEAAFEDWAARRGLELSLREAPLCGPGGLAVPRTAVLELVAEVISAALRRAPMPELAATTRIRAVHAVEAPLAKPVFRDGDVEAGTFRVARLLAATRGDLLSVEQAKEGSRAARLAADRDDWSRLSDDGATELVMAGGIGVDVLATRDVEIRATMVSPSSAVFDDVRRGRSLEEKMRGAYRPPGFVADPVGPADWPRFEPGDAAVRSSALYGFAVAEDGRVTLPRAKAPLLFVRDLPDTPLDERTATLRLFDLLDLQRAASRGEGNEQDADPASRRARFQSVQTFHDGLARRLDVEIAATSRFANLFPPEDRAGAGPATREAVSEARSIWLPATRRPDPLPARSLRPSFTWQHEAAAVPAGLLDGPRTTVSATRTCSINVPFDRPHFTSGEGERVGIVIWPPDLFTAAGERERARDRVRRDEQDVGTVELDALFSDADLGPGGPFVTRWGADPIREGPRPRPWLIPAKAFVDLPPEAGDAADPDGFASCPADGAVLERNVLMPVPRRDDAPPTAAAQPTKDGADTPDDGAPPTPREDVGSREYMLVSLLTYEPRFDVDYERWYVDIGIDAGHLPEPFLRLGLVRFQKHARRELQVSEPVVEWVPVIPQRRVCVSAAPDRGDLTTLTVEVTSPAAYDGTVPLLSPEASALPEPGTAPLLRATVIRTDAALDGSAIQSTIMPEEAITDPSVEMMPRRQDGGTVWSSEIAFRRPPPRAGYTTSYAVYVVEVDTYLPADPEGRTSGIPQAGTIESGPRFAAIVPVETPATPGKPPPRPGRPRIKPRPRMPRRPS